MTKVYENHSKKKMAKIKRNTFLEKIFYIGIGFALGSITFITVKDRQIYGLETSSTIEVCFTPGGKCRDLVIEQIRNAQKEILLQTYSFTSKEIADALLEAEERGVILKVLFDKSQLKASHSQIPKFLEKGINAKIDQVPGIAHNKVIIIDNKIVLTGSYNWTNAAEFRNSENLLILKDEKLASSYKENWQKRFKD